MLDPRFGAALGEMGRYSPFAAAPLTMLTAQQQQLAPLVALLLRQSGYRIW
jgi:hypothetical protein